LLSSKLPHRLRWENNPVASVGLSLLPALCSQFGASPFANFRRLPEVSFQVHTKFNDGNSLSFEKLFLEQGVWAANEDFSAVADHAVPRNAFSGRSGGHGAPGSARAAGQTEGSGKPSIR
jgi:hypothetical protein